MNRLVNSKHPCLVLLVIIFLYFSALSWSPQSSLQSVLSESMRIVGGLFISSTSCLWASHASVRKYSRASQTQRTSSFIGDGHFLYLSESVAKKHFSAITWHWNWLWRFSCGGRGEEKAKVQQEAVFESQSICTFHCHSSNAGVDNIYLRISLGNGNFLFNGE